MDANQINNSGKIETKGKKQRKTKEHFLACFCIMILNMEPLKKLHLTIINLFLLNY